MVAVSTIIYILVPYRHPVIIFNISIFQGGLLENSVKSDLDLGVHYDNEIQYETEEIHYESEVHVEDVNLGDTTNVYFNVGLESESEHSEVLSLASTSEDLGVTVSLNTMDPSHLTLSLLLASDSRAASEPGQEGQEEEAEQYRREH